MSNHHRFPHRTPDPSLRSLTGSFEEAKEATGAKLHGGDEPDLRYADDSPDEYEGIEMSTCGQSAHYSLSNGGQTKLSQTGRLHQEAKAHSGYSLQTPLRKTKALESLDLSVAWRKDKPFLKRQAVDIKDVKHSCVLQFALSSEKMKEFFMYSIKKEEIHISLEEMKSGHIHLDVTNLNCETEEEVQTCITSAFLKISFQDIDYLKMYKASRNFEFLEKSKSAQLDSLLENEELMLFDGTEAVYLVGHHKDLAKIEKELNLQKQDKRCLQDVYPWYVLETLKLEQYLKGRGLEITFEIHGETPTILGSVADVEEAEKIIKDFSADIRKRKVKFLSDEYKDLLSIDGIEKNDHVLGYFQKVFQSKKIICCVEIDKVDGEYCVNVISSVENVEKAEKTICNALCRHNLTVDKMGEIKDLIKHWEKKNKLKIVKQGKKTVSMICTSDVSEKILEELDASYEIPLSTINKKFVETHGRENLENLAKRHHLVFSIKDNILKLQGSKENMSKFKVEYRRGYVVDVSYIKVPPRFIYEHEKTLEEIASDNKCCFQPKYRDEKKDSLLQKCKAVASWHHVLNPEQVTLISGDIEDVQTDYRILFVTDNQFPLNEFSNNSGMKADLMQRTIKNGENTQKLGQILDIRELSKYGKCVTKGIVLLKSNSLTSEDKMNVGQIETAVMKVLNEALRYRAGTVVIPICLIDDKMQPAMIATACVNAIMSIDQTDTALHMYLLCGNNNSETVLAQTIDDIYQQKGRGYYRDVHSCDLKFNQGFHKITWSVEEASLLDMETDVIVNTVQCNLDLNVGKMSQQIVLQAGAILQEECNSKYPQGIMRGQLAVTSSGKLKAKMIFHCALPYFDKMKYIENIKLMVRLCLLEMDISNLKTIAFPAFGTGKLGYPVRETAKAMMDAIEEYQYCSIKSSVEKAMIVMLKEDIHSCKIFSQAQKRHRSNAYDQDVSGKEVFSGLSTSSGVNLYRVELNVGTEFDLGQLSSTVVDVEFVKMKGSKGQLVECKYWSDKPITERDVLKVPMDKTSDLTALTAAVQTLLVYCKENRISEISIPTLSKGVAGSAVEQIKVIQRLLQEDAKAEKTRCLSKVYIVVPGTESLEYLEKTLNTVEVQSFAATFRNFFSEKIVWRKKTCEDLFVEITVVGNKADCVQKTQTQIADFVNQLLKQSQERESIELADMSNETKGFTEVSKEGQNVDAEFDQVDLVSAELNPGVIKFLLQGGCFEEWKLKTEASFQLGFKSKDKDIVVVEGDFTNICSFEKYLEDTFPNDLEDFKEMKDVIYPTSKLSTTTKGPIPATEEDNFEINDKADKKILTGSFYSAKSTNINPDVKSTSGVVGSDDQCQKSKSDVKLSFELESLQVCLVKGDLTKQRVDCIVCSANESLVATGLAAKIATAAGSKFKEACRKEVNQHGRLQVGECRLMESGNLPCEKVLHVMGPSWIVGGRETQHALLKSMEDSVMNCLTKADHNRFSSVALPLIGTSKFPLSLLAQQYIRALNVFSKKRQHVSDIYIVEMDNTKLEKVVLEFKHDIKQMKDLPCSPASKESTIPTSSRSGISTPLGLVDIYMVVGHIESVQADAVVSLEDRSFSGRSGIAKALLDCGTTAYKHAHTDLLKGKKDVDMKVGSVLQTEGFDRLLCRYVLHTFVPRNNRRYSQIANGLENDIKITVSNVLAKATQLKCKSVAIPLLGVSENESVNTPVETCCQAIIDGIEEFLQKQKTSLNRIEFICPQPAVVHFFREAMEKRKRRERETVC